MSRNVVTFRRNGEYLYQRAMISRREGRLLDALKLLRQGMEAEPGDERFVTALSEILWDSGSLDRANSLLLDRLAGHPEDSAPSRQMLADRLLRLGMTTTANALYRSLKEEPPLAEPAYSELPAEWEDAGGLIWSRYGGRYVYLLTSANDALMQDRPEDAIRRFEKSFRLSPPSPTILAQYAWALSRCGRREPAVRNARAALMEGGEDFAAVRISAEALVLAGKMEEGRKAYRHAERLCPMGPARRGMAWSLFEADMMEDAAEFARLALEEAPLDAAMLHLRAAALARCGADVEAVAHLWQRMLEVDPEHPVAAHWLSICREGTLNPGEIPALPGELPRDVRAEWMGDIISANQQGAEALRAKWADEDFRARMRWLVRFSESDKGREAGMMILAGIADDAAKSLLRECLFSPGIGAAAKRSAVHWLRAYGVDVGLPVDADDLLDDCKWQDSAQRLRSYPVGERQMVRFASDVLWEIKSRDYAVELFEQWEAFRANRPEGWTNVLRNTEAVAAALCAVALGEDADETSRWFRARKRETERCCRYIRRTIARKGGKA